MIAAVCSWHEHHSRIVQELETRFTNKQQMVLAAPALVEAYSVLTRLPAPHRIGPTEALVLLESNFVRGRKIVALTAVAYCALLRKAPESAIAGGQTYDAVIAACARKAKVGTLLTFNEVHFAALGGPDLEIV